MPYTRVGWFSGLEGQTKMGAWSFVITPILLIKGNLRIINWDLEFYFCYHHQADLIEQFYYQHEGGIEYLGEPSSRLISRWTILNEK